jgi:hypothetical protein
MRAVPKIVDLEYLSDYVLRLHYRDGFVDDVDFEPFMHGKMSSALRDSELFKQVRIEAGGLVWPNGYDVCPTLLRYHLEPAHAVPV